MPQNKILTLSDLKARHTLLVLDTLRRHDGLSRVELARVAGCDNTTVTRAIRDLMACGLGACLCCVEKVADSQEPTAKSQNVCVCKEGPVFNIKRLLWQD